MGLDYRYLLFFEPGAEMEVLQRLAGISAERQTETSVEVPTSADLPYRSVTLPLRAWAGTPSHLWLDDPTPRWDFATVLAFEPDTAIQWYQRDDPRLDDQGRHEIGYIYLTVHRRIPEWASAADDAAVLFEFGTTGSKMSEMFSESESVRRSMVSLLEECRGVCGIFDWEDHATLFWWRGQGLEVDLASAEMDLAEVERAVPPEEPAPEKPEEPAPEKPEEPGREKPEEPEESELAAPLPGADLPEPSFWTPRNSTCDPWWRRMLDRLLMRRSP